jgi:hypothetical protein
MMCGGLYLRVMFCMILLFTGESVKCQITGAGARSGSLAGVTTVLQDAWASMNNPAGLAGYDHLSLATGAEQRFLMAELGHYALAATIPAGQGCIGIATAFAGYRSFIDQDVTLSYGRVFGEFFQAGAGLVYIFQKSGNGSQSIHQVSYLIGMRVSLSKKLQMAISTFNPFQYYYKSGNYATLSSDYRLGLSYQYSSSFYIYSELEKTLDLPPLIKVGTELNFREVFSCRTGIRGLPFSYSFGGSFRLQHFLFEFASVYQQDLGFTPQFSIQFEIK